MKGIVSPELREGRRPQFVVLALVCALVVVGVLILGAGNAVSAAAPGNEAPAVTCPLGQCFQDVDASNPFYAYINSLFEDNIIGGYTCGSIASEPCIPPYNRPYYRSGNNVNRGQMSKFVDNGRRNIADAIGIRLVMTNPVGMSMVLSNTTSDSLDINNASGNEALQVICTRAGQNCWAVYAGASAGDYSGVFNGGRGMSAGSSDAGYSAVHAQGGSSAVGSYGLEATANYRGGYVKSTDTGLYSLYVDTQGGPSQGTAGLEVNGSIRGEGNLYIAGSKAGYVVDIMQNVDSTALQPGDVVTIVGNSAPVLGQIPAVTVRRATIGYDTGVVGIVDQVMYVPDAATKAAYQQQEAALKTAMEQRNALMSTAADRAAKGLDKPDPGSIAMPSTNITDEQGELHALPNATEVAPNGYLSVVTLGSYKAVKVDASFGAIHAGDLLTTSPHAGYAMKVTDRAAAMGAVIGKALGDLSSGTGVVPIMVTLK